MITLFSLFLNIKNIDVKLLQPKLPAQMWVLSILIDKLPVSTQEIFSFLHTGIFISSYYCQKRKH